MIRRRSLLSATATCVLLFLGGMYASGAAVDAKDKAKLDSKAVAPAAKQPDTAPNTAASATPSAVPSTVPSKSSGSPTDKLPEKLSEKLPETTGQGVQPGPDYIIGPGDALQIFVWRNPELSTAVPVRPDGKISTPLVEDMIAVGKTPTQLARDVEQVLSEFIRSPRVNIIVTQPVSMFSQIKVVGQVARPQSMAYREGMTVLDAVLAAGGLTNFAAGNRSKVVRTESGKQKEMRVKLADLINDGAIQQNLLLKAGDVVVIPESRF